VSEPGAPFPTTTGPVTTGHFRVVFVLLGLLPLLGFMRLSPSGGAEVSGYRVPTRKTVEAD
jgi:hypothetical protein